MTKLIPLLLLLVTACGGASAPSDASSGSGSGASTIETAQRPRTAMGAISPQGGTITAVTPGFGETGGGTHGPVTLAVDPTVIQERVTGTCGAGTAVGAVNGDGSVSCNSAPTYSAGTGLQLISTTFSVNLTPTTCSAGQAEVATAAAGTSTCGSVLTTPGTGLASSGAGDVHVNLSTTTCSAGQAETSTAANGTSGCSTFINAGTNGVSCSSSTCQLDSTYAPTFAGLTDTGQFATPGVITVTDTGSINDYTPAGLSGASVIVFNGASTLTLTGISGGAMGRQLTLCNISANSITLLHETSSSAANRFNFVSGTSATLGTGGANKTACLQLIYLAGSVNRWTQMSMYASVSQTVGFSFATALLINAGATIQGVTSLSGIAHIRTGSTTPPTVGTCGTGATITGTDTAMTVATGTGATGCTITFGSSNWGSAHPACHVYPEGGAAFPAVTYTSTTTLTLGSGTAASTSYDIQCIGVN